MNSGGQELWERDKIMFEQNISSFRKIAAEA
jgi:hypothetical protein